MLVPNYHEIVIGETPFSLADGIEAIILVEIVVV